MKICRSKFQPLMVLASMYFRLYWKALALCYWGTTSRLTVFENQAKSLVFAHYLQIEKSIVQSSIGRIWAIFCAKIQISLKNEYNFETFFWRFSNSVRGGSLLSKVKCITNYSGSKAFSAS